MILTGLHRKGQSNDRFRSKMYEVRRMMSGVYEGVFLISRTPEPVRCSKDFRHYFRVDFAFP